VLDTHLGKLAKHLRMLGFDSLYRNDYDDATLAELGSREKRILLTRDQGLLKRRVITRGYYVRETQPKGQLREILRRFDLYRAMQPFRRCLMCNGLLAVVGKERVAHRLEANTRRYFDHFWLCGDCGRIYWKGSHYRHMQVLLQALRQEAQ
jgi:hypothetical protein